MDNTTRKKIIQEYYARRSNDYDRQKSRTWKSSRGFSDEVAGEMLDALAALSNGVLLEVGTGSGRNALPLLEKANPHLIIGLDLSREMLKQAKEKALSYKGNLHLVMGDGERLPFADKVFDAIVCMSTMHYFVLEEGILHAFFKVLREKGVFVCGDLTIHESDGHRFLESLERIVSKAHAAYHKPSEMRKLMETHGFRVTRMRTFAYRKSLRSLIEDKGGYFDVSAETLYEFVHAATAAAKIQYHLTNTELTLYYTIIVAQKET